jgi:glycosyltransferase involved in cell wall biosynthesis
LSLRRASIVTTISHTTAKAIRQYLEFVGEIRVAYPGVSPRKQNEKKLSLDESQRTVFEQVGIDAKGSLFCPGRTDFIGKGLDILLKAYSQLPENLHSAPNLIFAGPMGIGHEKFIEEISRLGLERKVKYVGRVTDECMDALYSLAICVVIASRYEGFGFPALEAMSHGVPLICTNGGSLPEIARGACLNVPVADVTGLSAAIVRVLSDQATRKALIKGGQERIRDFSWKTTCEQMHETFVDQLQRLNWPNTN